MDTWDLIKTGRYSEAVELLTDELRKQAQPYLYSNRGIAYLNLQQFDHAREDFEAAEETSASRGDSYRLHVSAVQWLQGFETEAAETWEAVVRDLDNGEIVYTDAAGGVEAPALLWFAGVRLDQPELCNAATKSLRKTLRSKRATSWPGVIGQLVLRRGVASDGQSAVSNVPILRERQLCQAEFYIAWSACHDGRYEDWRRALSQCARLDVALLEEELYLSKHELRRLEAELGL
jgi:tetratricopeptide (TPR) repeat protein